jgi:hypothetical protein
MFRVVPGSGFPLRLAVVGTFSRGESCGIDMPLPLTLSARAVAFAECALATGVRTVQPFPPLLVLRELGVTDRTAFNRG